MLIRTNIDKTNQYLNNVVLSLVQLWIKIYREITL